MWMGALGNIGAGPFPLGRWAFATGPTGTGYPCWGPPLGTGYAGAAWYATCSESVGALARGVIMAWEGGLWLIISAYSVFCIEVFASFATLASSFLPASIFSGSMLVSGLSGSSVRSTGFNTFRFSKGSTRVNGDGGVDAPARARSSRSIRSLSTWKTIWTFFEHSGAE